MLKQNIMALALAGLSLLGTLYVQLTHDDKANAARISALEAHRTDGDARLDHIQQQVDRLVEWALGHK